jgi:NitT/TauT family transport system permease protein
MTPHLVPRVLGPVAVFAVVLLLWWAVTALGWIDPLVLPSPLAVAAVFWTDAGTLAVNAGVTATEAVTGLIIGNAIGLLLAILFVGSPTSRRSVLPLAMAAQSIPIVAVTPALIIGFGNGMEPKILVAIFLVFFPMLVNGMRGLRSADAEVGELLHSLSATGLQRLWMVRLPAALPSPSSSRRSNSPPAAASSPPSWPNGSRRIRASATSSSSRVPSIAMPRSGRR